MNNLKMNKHRIKLYFSDVRFGSQFKRPFTWNKNVKTNKLRENKFFLYVKIIYK